MGIRRAGKLRKTRRLNKKWVVPVLLFLMAVRKPSFSVDTVVRYEPHYTTTVVVPDNSAEETASGIQVKWTDGQVLTHRALAGY